MEGDHDTGAGRSYQVQGENDQANRTILNKITFNILSSVLIKQKPKHDTYP